MTESSGAPRANRRRETRDALDILRMALATTKSGHPRRAEALCRDVLDRQPRNSTALQLLGSILLDRGDPKAAAKYLRQAVACDPRDATVLFNLATVLLAEEKFDAAAQAFLRVLDMRPGFVEAWSNLGAAHSRLGRFEDAAGAIRKAIELRPDRGAYHANLGVVLVALGRAEEAVDHFHRSLALRVDDAETLRNLAAAYKRLGRESESVDIAARILQLKDVGVRKPVETSPAAGLDLARTRFSEGKLDEAAAACRNAIALQPGYAEAHNMLGCVLAAQDQHEPATAAFQRAVLLNPKYADAHHNLGRTWLHRQRLTRAKVCCRRAISLRPDFADAHLTLGLVSQAEGKLEEAILSYRAAIAFNAAISAAYCNLGAALQLLGHVATSGSALPAPGYAAGLKPLDNAIDCYRASLALDPENSAAHLNLAMALLLLGDFANGWKEYEWRWPKPAASGMPDRFEMPLWNGEDLRGKSIILHAEQGFGDTLQFVRYAAQVAALGGEVALECQAELVGLLESVAGAKTVFKRGDALPPADYHVPLMSLPRLLGTTVETIPAPIPYLRAPTSVGTSMLPKGNCFKVGMVWSGNAKFRNDAVRSCPIEHFIQLSKMAKPDRLAFYSLQVGGRKADMRALRGTGIQDLGSAVSSFDESARIVSELDLVVSVDTATAHLAGALGSPLWLVLPFSPDWRWLLGRNDSPWYPSVRLFRQPKVGDWAAVFSAVAEALALRVAAKIDEEPSMQDRERVTPQGTGGEGFARR